MDAKEGAAPSSPAYGPGGVAPPVSMKPPTGRATEPRKPSPTSRQPTKPVTVKDRERVNKHLQLPPVTTDCKCDCRSPMVSLKDLADRRYAHVSTGGELHCAQPCHSVFFSKTERHEAMTWITGFAIACAVCTGLTVLTFWMDTDRFRYPERAIIFLSFCHLMVASGFIYRFYTGHENIACDGDMIRYSGTGPTPPSCVIVFLLVYFFGMASAVWWVILTFTWFLASGLKWGNEAIASYSLYFHLLAWFVPVVQSIFILATGAVDGDPFSGLCSVGNLDTATLKTYVVIPLSVYIGLGVVFLVAGFVSLYRIRRVIRQQARNKADKLERLMVRIVVFSVLYLIPTGLLIACYLYEMRHRRDWERAKMCPCAVATDKPSYTQFLLKYIAHLVVGITSGFWIWSGKTIESWFRFIMRVCCGGAGGSSVRSHSAASHLMTGSQLMVNGSQRYKPIPVAHQVAYSSTSHIGSNYNPASVQLKQLPLSHV